MPVETNGVVLTKEKDFWVISGRIAHAIYDLTVDGWANATQEERSTKTAPYTLPEIDMATSFSPLPHVITGYFTFAFRYKGEHRILSVHTHSKGDIQQEFGKESDGILIKLGYWGASVELIEAILSRLDDMGDCFIEEDDSEAEGFRPIQKAAA